MTTALFPVTTPSLSAESQALAFSVVSELAATTPAAAACSNMINHQPIDVIRLVDNNQKIQRFVQKLWKIVNSKSDLVGWSPDGSRVVVRHPRDFAKQILPHYFNTSNMSSFTRQLHFYGFKKTLSANRGRPENWECQHEHFVRDHPEWLVRITRKRCNVQMASQEETGQLRKEIDELREVVARQQKQMQSMAAMLLALNSQATQGTDRKRKAGGHFARVQQEPHVRQPISSECLPSLPLLVNPDENQLFPPTPMLHHRPEEMKLGDGFELALDDISDIEDLTEVGFNYWS